MLISLELLPVKAGKTITKFSSLIKEERLFLFHGIHLIFSYMLPATLIR